MISFFVVTNFGLGSLGGPNILLLVLPIIIIVAAILILRTPKSSAFKRILVSVGAVVLVVILILAVYAFPSTTNTSSGVYINIGHGYVEFSCSETGTVNVSTSQIVNVSVVHMDTGLLVMKRDHGYGGRISQTVNYHNLGVYTLANGAIAYVASNNLTNLVVALNTGKYLVLAPEHNVTAFLTDFSKYVTPVPGY